MSIKKVSKEQPDSFEFNEENLKIANDIVKNYPGGKQQSAVMSFLYLAQRQNNNWIPLVAVKYIAKLLNMPYIKVYEVATFYSMYNLSPVGKYFVENFRCFFFIKIFKIILVNLHHWSIYTSA